MGKTYTKGGDGGFSVLSSDMKISKADERFEALGCIDELSSHIGLCRAIVVCPKLNGKLQKIQSVLSKIASGITYPNDISYAFDGSEIAWLEEKIDNTQNSFDMGGEKNLGKCELSARLDVCAAVCRRLERALVSAGRKYNISKSVIAYINRLSDYFFVLARRIDFDDANGNLSQIVGNKSINGQNANEISVESIVGEVVKSMKFGSDINLKTAKALSEGVLSYAEKTGLKAVVAVCNSQGRPVTVDVMDGAYLVSFDVAVKKAYTAVAVKMTTEELGKQVEKGGALYGFDDKSLVYFGGGVPLKVGGTVVGGLGVSGGTAEQDASLANFGARLFEEITK